MKRATPWQLDEAHKLADTLSYANDHGQNVKLDYRPVISHTLDEAEMKHIPPFKVRSNPPWFR